MYDAETREAAQVADAVHERLLRFLHPLLTPLDDRIDHRLVRTFVGTVEAIICYRNRPHGLLLSELGPYLLEPEHAPAGTKRLSNLLRCAKWSSQLIAQVPGAAGDQPSGGAGAARRGGTPVVG